MATKKRTRRRPVPPPHPFYDAWHMAYHDALYAIMLDRIEEELKDPRRREIVERFARELAATFTDQPSRT